VSRRSPKPPPDGTIGQMPVVVGSIGKKHASEALHWAAEEALYRAAALGSSGRGRPRIMIAAQQHSQSSPAPCCPVAIV